LNVLISISVFALFHPRELALRPAPGEVLRVHSPGGVTRLEGAQVLRLRAAAQTEGEFLLAVPGKIERRFRGRLEVRPEGRELRAIVTMDLETAVASVVAAEMAPGAPLEALKAQAVAARSFFLAARGRHRAAGFDFCDTTHCQWLRHPPQPGQRAARAAVETRGLVLTYHAQVVEAYYSAACGGATERLAGPYPYASVACVRHPRRGHGIGLCQEGAAVMAGAGFREILGRYYPNTAVEGYRDARTGLR
jgi:peptidoglycan hydrolase-like amidase